MGETQHEDETPVIECDGLTCGYAGEPVLRDVTFTVAPGESVAILGRSGSGKSTLIRTFCGLLPPLAGTFRLFGHELYAIPERKRREVLRRTGVVFQHDALLGSLTLAQNIAFPMRELTQVPDPVIEELARLKLAMVHLSPQADRLPAEVSGGQRRRAAVARGSALDPALILCDEPTTGLDPVTAAHLELTLLRFRALLGSSLLVVTHELATVRAISDRIVMVGNGRVCAAGTYHELEASQDPEVHAFFHRVPRSPGERSLLEQLERPESSQ